MVNPTETRIEMKDKEFSISTEAEQRMRQAVKDNGEPEELVDELKAIFSQIQKQDHFLDLTAPYERVKKDPSWDPTDR